jgi:hypothetical protein
MTRNSDITPLGKGCRHSRRSPAPIGWNRLSAQGELTLQARWEYPSSTAGRSSSARTSGGLMCCGTALCTSLLLALALFTPFSSRRNNRRCRSSWRTTTAHPPVISEWHLNLRLELRKALVCRSSQQRLRGRLRSGRRASTAGSGPSSVALGMRIHASLHAFFLWPQGLWAASYPGSPDEVIQLGAGGRAKSIRRWRARHINVLGNHV